MLYTNFSTQNPTRPKIAVILPPHNNTASKSNSLTPLILQPDCQRTKLNTSNKSSAHSYFYGRVVDPTLLTALGKLSSAQATATNATKTPVPPISRLLHHPPASTICYHASDMVVKLHSDSSYLNAVGARSHQCSHFFLGHKSRTSMHFGMG